MFTNMYSSVLVIIIVTKFVQAKAVRKLFIRKFRRQIELIENFSFFSKITSSNCLRFVNEYNKRNSSNSSSKFNSEHIKLSAIIISLVTEPSRWYIIAYLVTCAHLQSGQRKVNVQGQCFCPKGRHGFDTTRYLKDKNPLALKVHFSWAGQ